MSVIALNDKRKILNTSGPSSKKFPAIYRRVEMLGRLNDRHKQALGAGDRQALVELAGEYAEIGCPRLANEIVAEADGL